MTTPAVIAHTERLVLRELAEADAPFVRRLVTDPDWLRHIGDRGVHTLGDARAYIRNGPQTMIRDHGVGLWLVEAGAVPVGLCGLLWRDGMDGVDLGYALLPEHRGAGFASEASQAVLEVARDTLSLTRVAAYVSPGNDASVRVLIGLGFVREGEATLGTDTVDAYAVAL